MFFGLSFCFSWMHSRRHTPTGARCGTLSTMPSRDGLTTRWVNVRNQFDENLFSRAPLNFDHSDSLSHMVSADQSARVSSGCLLVLVDLYQRWSVWKRTGMFMTEWLDEMMQKVQLDLFLKSILWTSQMGLRKKHLTMLPFMTNQRNLMHLHLYMGCFQTVNTIFHRLVISTFARSVLKAVFVVVVLHAFAPCRSNST